MSDCIGQRQHRQPPMFQATLTTHRFCAECGTPEFVLPSPLSVCGCCFSAWYCSRLCQEKAWIWHEDYCKSLSTVRGAKSAADIPVTLDLKDVLAMSLDETPSAFSRFPDVESYYGSPRSPTPPNDRSGFSEQSAGQTSSSEPPPSDPQISRLLTPSLSPGTSPESLSPPPPPTPVGDATTAVYLNGRFYPTLKEDGEFTVASLMRALGPGIRKDENLSSTSHPGSTSEENLEDGLMHFYGLD